MQDVTLAVQFPYINVFATITDPGGTAALENVQQAIGVYPSNDCTGTPIVVRDDVSGSGVEESFGIAVDRANNPALYDSIARSSGWPVHVELVNRAGNRSVGRVRARVQTTILSTQHQERPVDGESTRRQPRP